jgi:SSS family solute:Na+ symporter/sodium/pantothenate symporter
VGGISIVMQRLLGISNVAALGITLTFVTGYVFIGGAYAHVLTNMLQGSLMILVTLVVIGSGVAIILAEPGSVAERLAAADPNLLVPVNTGGQLFNDTFSVLACQPHILTKALYVKTDEAVHRYLLVFAAVFFLFLLLASVGFLAHLVVPETALVDETTGAFRQDLVMTVYLQTVFPDWVFTIISVVLLAAAMSTLDGLLVSLSTITANDLVLNLVDRFSPRERTPEERMRLGMRASHVVLVVIAVAAFLVNLDPPRLLGIFGQVGVYGLAVAAAPPLIAGVLFRDTSVGLLWAASAGALAVHLGLYLYGSELLPGVELTFANPGVTGTIGAIVGIVPVLLGGWWLNRNAA